MRLASLPLLALAFLLSSCQLLVLRAIIPDDCNTNRVTVPESPHVLKGTWEGSVANYPQTGDSAPLRLDLIAHYLGEQTYGVLGAFTLGGAESRRLEGTVSGGCFQTYVQSSAVTHHPNDTLEVASAPPPPRLEAQVFDKNGALLWRLDSGWNGLPSTPSTTEQTLRLTLYRPDEWTEYTAELVRAP